MPARSTASSLSTPDHLLRVAERLFAEQGIDAVSTREIARAAKQRNHSVVAYHFGSKEDLIQEILDLRLLPIAARRKAMLDDLRSRGTIPDVRSLVAVLVVPFAKQLGSDPDECNYIGFVSNLVAAPTGAAVLQQNPDRMASAAEVIRLLDEALESVPRATRKARLDFLAVQIAQIIADWDRRRRAGDRSYANSRLDFLTGTLIDTLAAGLLAPPSDPANGSPTHTE